MRSFSTVICIIFLFLLCGCYTSKEEHVEADKNTEEASSFIPVTDFILGQLNITEGLPVTPLKITINGNRKDSVWLKKEDIRKFAFPFLHPVIDSIFIRNYFTMKAFVDQTINAVTFSYDAKAKLPDSIKLDHWDVYVDPQKNNIQRVYLVKEEAVNGKSITTQLTWKANKWCSIRTIVQQPDKDPQIKEEIIKWDFDE